jgi:hypothetical protein
VDRYDFSAAVNPSLGAADKTSWFVRPEVHTDPPFNQQSGVTMALKLNAGAPNAGLPDEIRAWGRFAQGDLPGAVSLLQPVADRQDKLGEGGIEVPAREMLADVLFLNGQSQAIRIALTRF